MTSRTSILENRVRSASKSIANPTAGSFADRFIFRLKRPIVLVRLSLRAFSESLTNQVQRAELCQKIEPNGYFSASGGILAVLADVGNREPADSRAP